MCNNHQYYNHYSHLHSLCRANGFIVNATTRHFGSNWPFLEFHLFIAAICKEIRQSKFIHHTERTEQLTGMLYAFLVIVVIWRGELCDSVPVGPVLGWQVL
jgi:hypothetical protein